MEDFKKSLRYIRTFVRIDVKRLFRDKVAIFFVFIFPLIFLFVFGSMFGGDDELSFKVGVLNRSNSEISSQIIDQAKESGLLKVDEEVTNMDIAREKMNRGEIDATITLPENFGEIENGKYPTGTAEVLYDQNSEQAGTTLVSVMEALFQDVNKEFVSQERPFTVEGQSTATPGQRRFDYTFAGLLGFTLMSMGIFGPTTVFPRLKQRGVLRRYNTTTLKVWEYFVGNVISNAIVGILSVAVMFAAAMVFFDLNMNGDYLSLLAVVILGVTTLFGIGLAVGGWAKNENQAAPMAQLVTFPMMFLSGVFFPTFLMPELLQKFTKFIPLTPIIDSIRYVVTEGKTLFDLGPELAIMGGWLIVIYFIAFKVFRWE